jgi:hypothetical protein
MLNKESILKSQDLKTIDVKVPEWGGSIRIRTMTGIARQEYYRMTASGKDGTPKNVMEALIVACAVDEAGNPIFATGDIKDLSNKSAIAISRVFEAAAELNGLTQKSVDNIAGE